MLVHHWLGEWPVLWLLLPMASVLANPVDPTITQAPNAPLLQRRQGGAFIAYIQVDSGSQYSPFYCPTGYSPHTSDTLIACWTTTAATARFFNACANTSVAVGVDGVRETCGSPDHCEALTVRKDLNDGSSNPTTLFICGADPLSTGTLYLATTSGAITSSSTTTIPPTVVPTPATSQNLAWVAGPVVGGVVGIAILAALIWYVMRGRAKGSRSSQPTEAPHFDKGMSPAPAYSTLRTQQNPAELHSTYSTAPPAEMYSSPPTAELPAQNSRY